MTVHFFTKGDVRLGDSRQRAFRVAEELNARGVLSVVHAPPVRLLSTTPWPKKFSLIVATIRALSSIKGGDVVFLQRTIGNKYFFVLIVLYIKIFRRKMIFDFDDAIYLHDFYKTKILTEMADAVIVCSQALAAWAENYNKNVHVIHTSLGYADYAKFTKEYTEEPPIPTIGWVGTAKDHSENLRFLASVLRRLVQAKGARFKFILVGAGNDKDIRRLFEGMPGTPTIFIDALEWSSPESVPREIQKFDIGVMPLVATSEWNLARSSFKPLEYMACGVATVASDVGEIKSVIQDGVNGFLADSEDAWVEKLGRLVTDRSLRASLGRAGQQQIREHECYDAVIPRIVQILQNLH